MGHVLTIVGSGSKSISLVLGAAVLAAAVASGMMGIGLREITDWALEVFSVTFIVLLSALLSGFAYCLVRLVEKRKKGEDSEVWLEAGMHVAGGVATI
ncbi:MAG: hypothetical protein CMM10_09270, partial [Rhodospirillaceae bacterium]|nr:hypothetical protein [Rhodospirillaceae bacterium]